MRFVSWHIVTGWCFVDDANSRVSLPRHLVVISHSKTENRIMFYPVALAGVLLISTPGLVYQHADQNSPPKVAQTAPDFQLKTPEGKQVTLTNMRKNGPVVVVVLRGFPGYQCPVCTRQVGSLLKAAKDFNAAEATVVFVYPGAAKELEKKAKEFLKDTELPKPFVLVTDPDYKFTNAYGLRWDAVRETAYPSTFVIGKDGKVTFALVSSGHRGRSKTEDVVAAVKKTK